MTQCSEFEGTFLREPTLSATNALDHATAWVARKVRSHHA
jgi:hypothetical protein